MNEEINFVVSPDWALALKNVGLRPFGLKGGQIWYEPKAKVYFKFKQNGSLKVDKYSIDGDILDIDLHPPTDFSRLIFCPSQFELQEYLERWICVQQNDCFICTHQSNNFPNYSGDTEANAWAKAWCSEQKREAPKVVSFKMANKLKKYHFPQPVYINLNEIWYDINGIIIKTIPIEISATKKVVPVLVRWNNNETKWIAAEERVSEACFAPTAFQIFKDLVRIGKEATYKPINENHHIDEEGTDVWGERWIEQIELHNQNAK